jgi:hypothetical protein
MQVDTTFTEQSIDPEGTLPPYSANGLSLTSIMGIMGICVAAIIFIIVMALMLLLVARRGAAAASGKLGVYDKERGSKAGEQPYGSPGGSFASPWCCQWRDV